MNSSETPTDDLITTSRRPCESGPDIATTKTTLEQNNIRTNQPRTRLPRLKGQVRTPFLPALEHEHHPYEQRTPRHQTTVTNMTIGSAKRGPILAKWNERQSSAQMPRIFLSKQRSANPTPEPIWPTNRRRTGPNNHADERSVAPAKIPTYGSHQRLGRAVSHNGKMDQTHKIPPDFPPLGRVGVSWDKQLGADNGTQPERRSNISYTDLRRNEVTITRTNQRITSKDGVDMSIIGESPHLRNTPRSGLKPVDYLPNDVLQILPNQLVGPDDFFTPGREFLDNIRTIMNRPPPTPSAPPFRFGTSISDLEHNARIVAAAKFDLQNLLPVHQQTTLGFGTEFRPQADLELLLGKHPHFPFVSKVLSGGMDYHYHDGADLTETDRLAEMAGQLHRGNHKSVEKDIDTVRELLSKDVTHGFTLPLPVECAPQIKGAMIQPLGVVKQWSLNATGERTAKFRLTQDLSFSLDAQDHSINGRVNLQRYPEMVYGWCMPRILHLVSALREQHPHTPLFICKYDYSDAYRRVAHSPAAAAQTVAVLDKIAYVSLRLTFGGSPNPPTWCAVSELVTDLANEIAWCSEWDPTTIRSSMMPAVIAPKRVDATVPFAQARPMAVRIPSITMGRVDVFVDDVIHVFPDTPGALERLPHVVPLAMELTSRVHAGEHEPIPRRPILSPNKLAAEGAPAEIQQVLGWNIDTRRMKISLPNDKFVMWIADIRRIQHARRSSTALLATVEGRLNHTASILPMARHFLTRLRKIKLAAIEDNRPYTKIPDEVLADLQLWEQILSLTHKGVSINVLTTRRPDIIGWSDACPFGLGGYNTTGRAWRWLINPNSPLFGISRMNNALEYIAMTVNAIVSCRDVDHLSSPCVLALGDSTSAIGWLYRSSRLSQPHHNVHLRVARHLAHETIRNNCCLYSQHIAGSRNIVADLLSFDGKGRDKPHPLAHDQPDDATLTNRFHSSPAYSQQITANFKISPLPPDIASWLQDTMQMLESYVLAEQNRHLSLPTELGDVGVDTVVSLEAPMTPHWTDYQTQPETMFHLLHCRANPERNKAIVEFKKSVRIKEQNRFGKIFTDIVDQWLQNPTCTPSMAGCIDSTINYTCYPLPYLNILNRAIRTQTQIGWQNLLKGFLATTWHELASTHFSYPEDSPSYHNNGSHQIAKSIRAPQTHSFNLVRSKRCTSSTT